MIISWALCLALLVAVQGHRLSPELLANFENNLLDEFRDSYAPGSFVNIDEFLAGPSGKKMQQRIRHFANSFQSDQIENTNHRDKRATPGYYGALLDSSK